MTAVRVVTLAVGLAAVAMAAMVTMVAMEDSASGSSRA